MSSQPGYRRVQCERWGSSLAGIRHPAEDRLVVEEPLEIRIAGRPLATVMRTPGDDRELALGFLFGEGIIRGLEEVGALCLCGSEDHPEVGNVADLLPAAGTVLEPPAPRATSVSASCGVCGKRTIAEVLAGAPALQRPSVPEGPAPEGLRLSPESLAGMPESLREAQRVFQATGALHGAGLFDPAGKLLRLKEDVGRHNAVDKVVGAALLAGEVPLSRRVLLVSGRASFEIVQKALRAGIPVVAAISGVSTLARDLAREGGLTLAGFLRPEGFKVYSHPERIG